MARYYRGMAGGKQFDLIKIAALIMISVYMIFTIFPVFWMLSTALKTQVDAYKMPPEFIPRNPTLDGFRKILTADRTVLRFFWNSLVIGGGAVALCLGAGILGGYSLSRFRSRTSRFIMMFMLVSQMFPLALLAIPLYVYFHKLHLLNTYFGVILVHSAIALPLSLWLLKGFFDTIPVELEEAARIDGCSRGKILTRIVMPLIGPGIITAAVYAFLISWREFLLALIFTSTEAVRPISPGLAVYYFGFASLRWSDVMATSLLTLTPLLIIYIFLQKYVISGLVGGAVKG